MLGERGGCYETARKVRQAADPQAGGVRCNTPGHRGDLRHARVRDVRRRAPGGAYLSSKGRPGSGLHGCHRAAVVG